MPTILKKHILWKPYRSLKSVNRQKKKETIAKLSKKVEITNHWEQRAEERATNKNKVKQDIINSIIQWRVKSQIRYKVYWKYWDYVLWENWELITVLSKEMKTPNFTNICKNQLNVLREILWLK